MYSQFTQAQFVNELASTLGDPGLVFWASDELTRALHESLLIWGALTSYWITPGSFTTASNVAFYDLSVQLPTLRRRSRTLGDLAREVQYHLLEPQANGVSGAGMTSQFTVGQIVNALKRRRNEFVIDTHLPLTTIALAGGSQVDLPQSVAAVDRVTWKETATGVYSPLSRTDPYAAQAFEPLWQLNPGNPYGYSQAESQPLKLTIVPPPRSPGSVELVYAESLDLAANDSAVLGVPDEFSWAIKWGALYDLLSTNNPGYDPVRAKYCLERYTASLDIAAFARSMTRVRVGGENIPLVTAAELDAGTWHWQTGSGKPRKAIAAYDLLSFYRVPNGAYTINLDVVQAAPISSVNVEAGREELPYLMDYCRHILSWKMGGAEFVNTMPLYDNFLAGAAKRNKRLETRVRYLTSLFQRADLTDQQVA